MSGGWRVIDPSIGMLLEQYGGSANGAAPPLDRGSQGNVDVDLLDEILGGAAFDLFMKECDCAESSLQHDDCRRRRHRR